MKKMKHIKLFEAWQDGDQGYQAISVFPEGGSDLYVGVFPTALAQEIESNLMSCSGILVNTTDVAPGDDAVVSALGGEGLHSASAAEFDALVIPGEDYLALQEDAPIPFLIDRSLNAFVGVNGYGMTEVVAPEKLISMFQ